MFFKPHVQFPLSTQKWTKEVAELEEAISTWNGDMKTATAVRNQEKTNYDTAVLKKSTADRKQLSLSVEHALIPATADTIDAIIQQGSCREPCLECS